MPGRPWFLYVVECADGTFYTGISIDVERRVREHNAGRGAKYTATRRPVVLRAVWRFPSRRTAMQAETALKQKRRSAKNRLVTAAESFHKGRWIGIAE
jgi:putative endonuclease